MGPGTPSPGSTSSMAISTTASRASAVPARTARRPSPPGSTGISIPESARWSTGPSTGTTMRWARRSAVASSMRRRQSPPQSRYFVGGPVATEVLVLRSPVAHAVETSRRTRTHRRSAEKIVQPTIASSVEQEAVGRHQDRLPVRASIRCEQGAVRVAGLFDPEPLEGVVIGNVPSTAASVLTHGAGASASPSARAGRS